MERAQGREWTGFASTAVCGAAAILAALLGAIWLIDPYDTGRSPFTSEPRPQSQTDITATASVGRDPRYTGAIVGNSTISQVTPSRLTELTGIPFAQLSVPGVHVREQLTVLDWFMRHHTDSARAVVISIDRYTWCTRDPKLTGSNPFPFWRYSRNSAEYLAGLLSMSSLKDAKRRLGLNLGLNTKSRRVPAAPDGFWDYGPVYTKLGYMTEPRWREALFQKVGDQQGDSGHAFPAADELERTLETLPPSLAVVLVFPPVFTASQSQPGTPRYAADQACRQRFIDLASSRPNTAVVDWWLDRPQLGNPDLFYDQVHYHRPIAHAIEGDIAAALRGLRIVTPVLPVGAPS